MAPPDGLEPPTRTLGRCRSIQLSYGGPETGYAYSTTTLPFMPGCTVQSK